MIRNNIYQSFDGMIPDEERRMMRYETMAQYQHAFAKTAMQNFTMRLHHLRECVCLLRRKGKLSLSVFTDDILAMRSKAQEAYELILVL